MGVLFFCINVLGVFYGIVVVVLLVIIVFNVGWFIFFGIWCLVVIVFLVVLLVLGIFFFVSVFIFKYLFGLIIWYLVIDVLGINVVVRLGVDD